MWVGAQGSGGRGISDWDVIYERRIFFKKKMLKIKLWGHRILVQQESGQSHFPPLLLSARSLERHTQAGKLGELPVEPQ